MINMSCLMSPLRSLKSLKIIPCPSKIRDFHCSLRNVSAVWPRALWWIGTIIINKKYSGRVAQNGTKANRKVFEGCSRAFQGSCKLDRCRKVNVRLWRVLKWCTDEAQECFSMIELDSSWSRSFKLGRVHLGFKCACEDFWVSNNVWRGRMDGWKNILFAFRLCLSHSRLAMRFELVETWSNWHLDLLWARRSSTYSFPDLRGQGPHISGDHHFCNGYLTCWQWMWLSTWHPPPLWETAHRVLHGWGWWEDNNNSNEKVNGKRRWWMVRGQWGDTTITTSRPPT
jgi:hypothetical protein